jgi:hypothetical protein
MKRLFVVAHESARGHIPAVATAAKDGRLRLESGRWRSAVHGARAADRRTRTGDSPGTASERLRGVIRRLDPEALAFFGPGHPWWRHPRPWMLRSNPWRCIDVC